MTFRRPCKTCESVRSYLNFLKITIANPPAPACQGHTAADIGCLSAVLQLQSAVQQLQSAVLALLQLQTADQPSVICWSRPWKPHFYLQGPGYLGFLLLPRACQKTTWNLHATTGRQNGRFWRPAGPRAPKMESKVMQNRRKSSQTWVSQISFES